MTIKPPPGPGTPLIEYPWVAVRFRCNYSERGGDSRTVACAIDFGSHAKMNELLHIFMLRRPSGSSGQRCISSWRTWTPYRSNA